MSFGFWKVIVYFIRNLLEFWFEYLIKYLTRSSCYKTGNNKQCSGVWQTILNHIHLCSIGIRQFIFIVLCDFHVVSFIFFASASFQRRRLFLFPVIRKRQVNSPDNFAFRKVLLPPVSDDLWYIFIWLHYSEHIEEGIFSSLVYLATTSEREASQWIYLLIQLSSVDMGQFEEWIFHFFTTKSNFYK